MITDHFEIYNYSDQPTTCPNCGNRTDIIWDLPDSKVKTQFHKCLSNYCRYEFLMQEDDLDLGDQK